MIGTQIDIFQRSNLTRLQLLFWVGQRLRPEMPLFNAIQTFTIPMQIDPGRFETAFQTLLQHSDALRTVLEETEGVPQQKVISGFSDPLDMLDFSNESDPEAEYKSWLEQRRKLPIDLEQRPFDAALIKIADDRFIWYFNQHHVIADAASSFLAFERLAQFYEHPLIEQAENETALHPFADYVRYERAYRNSAQYSRDASYWDRKLTPHPEAIQFFGHQPTRKTSKVQRATFELGSERSKKFRALARRKDFFTVSEELTLFSIFAALFSAQLYSMSGSRRLGLLVPVHNRFRPALKTTLGLVMEYCPVQVELAPDDSLPSLIANVQREIRETFAHYQYGSGLSLQDQAFDIIFNMYQVPELQMCGVPVQAERVYPGYGSERLALHVTDLLASGEFALHFDFSCDVFTDVQRQQTVREFVELLDLFLADPGESIGQIDLLQTEWNSAVDTPDQTAATPGSAVTERAVTAPRDELERELIQIWERVLGVSSIGIRDNFFELGGSSWLAVRLFAEIERELGRSVPLRTLVQAGTVEELAERLRQETEPVPWSPLVAIQSEGARTPFFCVHGAGGHVLLYEKVARHLGADHPFYAFQAYGIEAGQEPFTRVEDMAALYVRALREFQPTGPYLLGGYSMGGIVAFEMAQQLQAQGQEVGLLAVLDVPSQSPHLKYVRQLAELLGTLLRMSSSRKLQLFLRLRYYAFRVRYFRRLNGSKRIAYLRRKLGSLGGRIVRTYSKQDDAQDTYVAEVPDEAKVDALAKQRLRRLYALNSDAYRAYIPRRYHGRVAIIRSIRGYTGDPDKDYSDDAYLGWGKVLSGPIETYEVPGDHHQMIREPYVRVLAEHLRTCLESA